MTTVMQDDPQPKAKPFEMPKRLIREAWKHVAADKVAPGVDTESIKTYQSRLRRNFYTVWSRMRSGSYLPQLIRKVLIPKDKRQTRPLVLFQLDIAMYSSVAVVLCGKAHYAEKGYSLFKQL